MGIDLFMSGQINYIHDHFPLIVCSTEKQIKGKPPLTSFPVPNKYNGENCSSAPKSIK